jgi:NADH:ubiquinone oxidoreductase subunit 3 (subunit A)
VIDFACSTPVVFGGRMLSQWTFLALFLPVAFVFAAIPIVAQSFLGPHKPNAAKQAAYECGMETVGDTWVQFKVQYYIFALIFVIFAVEAVFLFPWAAAYDQMPLYMVLEGILFLLILAGGLAYAWRKGALEWV